MQVQQLQDHQIAETAEVERTAWGDLAASAEQIEARSRTCPEGSIVAMLEDGSIVGYAAAQRVAHISNGTWHQQTDNGWIRATHVPCGPIAYGVSMSVLPRAARLGVSGAIIFRYAEVFVLAGGCSMMCLGSRLPGFARWSNATGGDLQSYLAQRRNDRSIDPELCLYERSGFQVLFELEDYFPDPRSAGHGAMVAMNRWTAQTELLTAA